MTSDTVNALADHLAKIDADWRLASGYTGRAVHRRAYWRNMAARLLTDSVKALAEKPNAERINPPSMQPESKETRSGGLDGASC